MIWIGLSIWSIWGVCLCFFYGRRVVLQESDFRNVLFVIACGPLVWLAIAALWLWDRLTHL